MNAEKNIFVEREVFEKDGKSYFSYFIRGNVRGKDVRVAIIPHLRAQGTGSFAFSQSISPSPFLGSRSARYRFNRLKQKEGGPSRSSATCPKVTPKNCEICIFIFRQLYGIIKNSYMAASRKEYPMTEHPSSKNKRDAIRRISRDTGVSESSIYKILANPFSFSRSTVDMVRREAEKYGLTLSGDGLSEGVPESSSPRRPLRISVVIPSRPLYFWREAVAGIEKSKAVLEKEGIPIQLRYSYHSFPQIEPDSLSLFSALESDNPDGLILFPVGGQACRGFLETASIPTVIFNDTQDYMTTDWFRAHAHTAFIGPDGYGEGERAASLIASCGVDIRSLGVICTRHNSSAQVSEQRVKGVCDKARELFPEAQIFHIELDPTARIAPSTLAQRLIGCFDGGDVDCLYISSGVTHIGCAAIEKIERRLARPLATFVIGHECSSADRRYLMEGRQRGYIKQDVYTQGFFALKDVAETCLGVGQLTGRLYPSSIFIR